MLAAQQPYLGHLDSLEALQAWRDLVVDLQRQRGCQLALATLAAVQGGLLLTQVRRDPAALEAALDAMLAHIASLAS